MRRIVSPSVAEVFLGPLLLSVEVVVGLGGLCSSILPGSGSSCAHVSSFDEVAEDVFFPRYRFLLASGGGGWHVRLSCVDKGLRASYSAEDSVISSSAAEVLPRFFVVSILCC